MLSVSLVRFCRQESGAIAPLFGLSILVLLILSGVAIDSARSYRIASSAGQALDAPALATPKALRLESPDDAALKKMATDYFKANLASEIPRHKSRWSQSISFSPTWDAAIDLVRTFATTSALGSMAVTSLP